MPLTPEFGKSFEHFILMELKAYQAYRNPELLLHYWRTSTGQEVDFILGDMEVAIEVKSSKQIHTGDLKGFKALADAHTVKRRIFISLEREARIIDDNIECLPWEIFLTSLWNNQIIGN